MLLDRIFRRLVILQVITIGAFIFVVPYDPAVAETPFTSIEIAGTVCLLIYWISLFLLFSFHYWGRIVFTVAVVLVVLTSFGATELTVPTGTVYENLTWFSGVLDGALLTMLYLTDIKERFIKSV